MIINRTSNPRLFLMAGLLLLSLPVISAQEYPKSVIKAELILRFISFVSWPNDLPDESYRIAFLGDDERYYEALERRVSNRLIKGRTLQLSLVNSTEELGKYHVLVVASNIDRPFHEVALAARRSSTLIISEEVDDETDIMINVMQTQDNTISFEVNKANILLEQLSVSNDILLLGGTELDVAHLYREMEQKLRLTAGEFNRIQEQSERAAEILGRTENILVTSQNNLQKSERELTRLNDRLEEQARVIADQETGIEIGQTRLSEITNSFLRNQKLLVEQNALLDGHTAEIERQQKEFQQNALLLEVQSRALAVQKENIEQQSSTIREQELLLFTSLSILLVFLVLILWIYRISQDRQRISLELEKRGETLEQEVYERTLALSESESRFRVLSELSPVGVYGTDSEGNCRYVNERWCEYSGLSKEDAMGMGWIQALHPDDRDRLSVDWTKKLEAEELLNSEYRYLTPDGEVRWLYGHCIEELDSAGNLLGYIGTVTDVTDQKHLQEQLRRTQKMDALGKLTGGIAHDYNNMLAVIIGFADLLKQAIAGQPMLEKYLDQISYASDRGAKLTEKLLAFSGQKPSDAVELNINQLLTDQKQLLGKTLTPRISLLFDLAHDLWPVLMTGGDLEDAILNISINAMHAIEGNGTFTIRSENQYLCEVDARLLQLVPGDYVLVSLTDDGCGMDEDVRERLFDPFFTTKGDMGSGLGLSQVYGFVERSRGVIKVHSETGKGTQFLLYFPRYHHGAQSVRAVEDSTVLDLKGHETILIVDDEPALLKLACEILTREGYNTVAAVTGKQALEILRNESIDLLITDVIMPEMDGYQLASIVRRKYPEVPIQLSSGFTDEQKSAIVDQTLQENILHKPYKSRRLLGKVRKLLDTA